jgi:hypothetical protein
LQRPPGQFKPADVDAEGSHDLDQSTREAADIQNALAGLGADEFRDLAVYAAILSFIAPGCFIVSRDELGLVVSRDLLRRWNRTARQ